MVDALRVLSRSRLPLSAALVRRRIGCVFQCATNE